VAVLDSGINTQHPDLAANLLGGRNFVADGPGGAVIANDIEDRHGHGSHIAGAIAGNGLIYGVGPKLGLRVYRVLGATNTGPSTGIIAAMVAAANDGVDVLSMSIVGFNSVSGGFWTAPDGTVYRYRNLASTLAYARAVRYAISKGAVVVVGAGNSALDIANPSVVTAYLNSTFGSNGLHLIGAARTDPSGTTGTVTVSATARSQAPASYTNYGAGVIKVAAPGGEFTDGTLSAFRADGSGVAKYAFMFGTSMATPKVSAVAALIIDQAKARGEKLTPAQVVTRLQQSAIDLGISGYDAFYGHGIVNAVSALTMR
jgi:subtilisin family serine protease